MSSTLVSALHTEERSIIAELRASKPFQRLESIHKLLALYDAKPTVAVSLGAADADRNAAPVIQLAPPPPSAPIPMPAPGSAEPAAVEPMRAAAPATAAIGSAAIAHDEPGGVVSSVRAALLGIGKA